MHLLLGMFLGGVKNLHVESVGPMPEKSVKKGNGSTGHQTVFPTSPTQDNPPPLSPEKTHVVVEAYEVYDRETELVLPCYIMMLDLYLKQVRLRMLFFGGFIVKSHIHDILYQMNDIFYINEC